MYVFPVNGEKLPNGHTELVSEVTVEKEKTPDSSESEIAEVQFPVKGDEFKFIIEQVKTEIGILGHYIVLRAATDYFENKSIQFDVGELLGYGKDTEKGYVSAVRAALEDVASQGNWHILLSPVTMTTRMTETTNIGFCQRKPMESYSFTVTIR